MEVNTEKEDTFFRLLQPELLSVEEIVQILKLLCVVRDLRNLTHDQLVELFKKVALPLPQRTYSEFWRGKLLNSKRLKYEKRTAKKRKLSGSESLKDTNGVCSKNLSPKDRLKPPVDMINYERKTIKLARSTIIEKKASSDLDKIIIKDRRREKSESKASGGEDSKRIVIINKHKEKSESKSPAGEELDGIVIKDRQKQKSETKSPAGGDLEKIVIDEKRKSKLETNTSGVDLGKIIIKDRQKEGSSASRKELGKIIINDRRKSTSNSKDLDKIVIKDRTKERKLAEEAKAPKENEIQSSEGKMENSSKKISESVPPVDTHKKIKLKRASFSDQKDVEKPEVSECSSSKKSCS